MPTTGLAEVLTRLAQVKAILPQRLGTALLLAVDETITQPSKDRVPIETSALHDSAVTVGPVIENGTVKVTVSYGSDADGPPASNSYAVFVHEDLSKQHPVGESKWLEKTAYENGPRLPEAIAEKVRTGL